MVRQPKGSSTQRWARLLQRATEVTGVLLLAFAGTLINLLFGWVALLFRSNRNGIRQTVQSVSFPVAAKSSK